MLLNHERMDWYCPNCGHTATTPPLRPGAGQNQGAFHPCPRLGGLTTPMLPAGVSGKVEALDREDYVGRDIPQRDREGRVRMSIVTERDNGRDTIVLAPTVNSQRGVDFE